MTHSRRTCLLMLALATACSKKAKPDAYGNFEAIEVTVSSQASGQLKWFTPVEGAKIGAGLEATTAVLTYGATNWEKLRIWAKERALISLNDEKLLSVGVNPKSIPTDKQSMELLKLRQRLVEEGF